MAAANYRNREGPLWKTVLIKKRPEIIKYLDINDVIDFLISKKVLTQNVAERIRIPLESQTRSERAGELLDYLRRRTETDYRVFVDSLEEANKGLYDILKRQEQGGSNAGNNEAAGGENWWKEVLREERVELTKCLDIRDVLDILIQKKVVFDETADLLRRAYPVTPTRRQKVEALLDYLNRRPDEDIEQFINILRESQQTQDLGERLQQVEVQASGSFETRFQAKLRRQRSDLVEKLEPETVYNKLITNGILSVNKAAELRKPDEATRGRQVESLLDYLHRRTEADYQNFKDSLNGDYKHLLKIITDFENEYLTSEPVQAMDDLTLNPPES